VIIADSLVYSTNRQLQELSRRTTEWELQYLNLVCTPSIVEVVWSARQDTVTTTTKSDKTTRNEIGPIDGKLDRANCSRRQVHQGA
jgi:hypothetical protein